MTRTTTVPAKGLIAANFLRRAFLSLLMSFGALLGVCAADDSASDVSASVASVSDKTASGASSSFSIEGITVGIDGFYKSGFRTGVAVRYAGAPVGRALTLELASFDSDKTPTIEQVSWSPEAASGGVNGLFSPGKASESLTVRVFEAESGALLAEKSIVPKKRTVPPIGSAVETSPFVFDLPAVFSRPAWLWIGAESSEASSDLSQTPGDPGLNALIGELRLDEPFRPQVSAVARFDGLPTSADGYAAVDLVFLTAGSGKFFDGAAPDDPRITALAEWVRRGGRLILLGGENALPLYSEGGALAAFLPGRVISDTAREIRIANALVQFVPKAKNLVMTGTLDNPYLKVPLIEPDADAAVDLIEVETPMLVRKVFGFGTVSWFAADTAAAPLFGWNGRTGLLMKIFGFDAEKIAQTQPDTALVQLGYRDLSGQMRSALDRFEGVRGFPFSLILILTFLYILVIGPFDWFLTHRVFRRPNLTWLTLPLWILLFAFGVLAIGRSIQPGEVRVNRVALVDLDLASQTVRGSGWTGFFSPADRRYDLRLTPAFSDPIHQEGEADVALTWLGLDGAGLGGLASKTISPNSWEEPYRIESGTGALVGLPAQVRSSRSLADLWFAKMDTPPFALTERDKTLYGPVPNPLGATLENVILYYDRTAYRIGTLPPEGVTIDKQTRRIDASRVLNGAVDPFNETVSNTMTQSGLARYSTTSADPAYILRMMTFYRLAGGEKAVGLSNARGTLLDATELLRTGRAVLTGTLRDDFASPAGENGAAALENTPINAALDFARADGSALDVPKRQALFVRMFIPVKK